MCLYHLLIANLFKVFVKAGNFCHCRVVSSQLHRLFPLMKVMMQGNSVLNSKHTSFTDSGSHPLLSEKNFISLHLWVGLNGIREWKHGLLYSWTMPSWYFIWPLDCINILWKSCIDEGKESDCQMKSYGASPTLLTVYSKELDWWV